MGKRIDATGRKIGCLTATEKLPSVKLPSGGTVGVWRVLCECGKTKPMRSSAFLNMGHFSCGKDCTLREDAQVSVKCANCEADYSVRRDSIRKSIRANGGVSHICRKCTAAIATKATVGKPAHNRLPGNDGGFNSLFSSYKKAAINRGLEFNISAEFFKAMTRKNCQYCGAEPAGKKLVNQKVSVRKGEPYVFNGVDRVDNTVGYLEHNVVPCCTTCNRMKGELSLADFISKAIQISKHSPKSGNRTFLP